MATDIVIEELTNGELTEDNNWEGTGVFDKLIEVVNKNIEGQFLKGRISGADYANVYLGSMQSVIAQSIQFVLQEKKVEADVELAKAQASELELNGVDKRLTNEKQREAKDAEIALLERQKEGFDDNKYQKLFDSQMNSWALMYSSGLLTSQPDIIANDEVTTLYNTLKPAE